MKLNSRAKFGVVVAATALLISACGGGGGTGVLGQGSNGVAGSGQGGGGGGSGGMIMQTYPMSKGTNNITINVGPFMFLVFYYKIF